MLKNLLFNSLADASEHTYLFQFVIQNVPMFEDSAVQCHVGDDGAEIYCNISIVDFVDFYLDYKSTYGNNFNGALQKVYEDLLKNIEHDYLKEHPEDTELEGMYDWFIEGASGDNSYLLQVKLLVTFEEESGNLIISGDVWVDSYSDIYRGYNIHVFDRSIDMNYSNSTLDRFKEQFFRGVLTSFSDLIKEL